MTDFIFTYDRGNLTDEKLIELYQNMLLPRMIEEKMLVLLRQGKISKWFSGIGQEAIAVGVTSCLEDEEYVLPMHRNLGVFTTRDIPLWKLFAQWQGKEEGFTKGRDRSFHFGTQDYNIVGMISHLGPQMGVADGIALSHQIRNQDNVTAVFTGEGGTSEGDFHEALNIASVWCLPVLFCVENNGYGLSTPTKEQYNCKDLADRGVGYGMESHVIDGNNILEVFQTVKSLSDDMRENPRPVLLEFKTFRRRGHEEASGTKYVPDELMDYWEARDPLTNYENYLLKEKVLSEDQIRQFKTEFTDQINEHLTIAGDKSLPSSSPDDIFNGELAKHQLDDVFDPYDFTPRKANGDVKNIRLIDAIKNGLDEAMQEFDDLVLMGQDIAAYGGVFKITEGFVDKFGQERVRNTPICESGIVETAMGLSIAGMKAVVEMQFADFVSSGFNPIVNYLAKSHYRWNQAADVVIRMPCGAGVGAGPFHSQTNESWFHTIPGLKIVYPSSPADAKGLLITAIEDPNPVLFFEHKALYRSVYDNVPDGYYNIKFGKARHLSEGDRLSIITYGAPVHWASELLEEYSGIDLIDLRTLVPLDWEAVQSSVARTGKVMVLCEDNQTGSVAEHIAARIADECFELLDAPVKTLGSLDTPIPFEKGLENQYLSKARLRQTVEELMAY